ncbi:MAG: branched-chain amino acid ABC transporter permease [Clostridia bacterium]|nr:branched-chain amino acid ABC transporter permease [Clostridia bacterium]
MSKKAKGYLLNTAVIAAALLIFFFYRNSMMEANNKNFRLSVIPSIWQCCYLIILAASLNLVLGFMGQLSIAQCGFMAIGAYTAALMSLAFERAGFYTDKSGLNFTVALILSFINAGLLSALVGLVVGIPALRLKGDYLAIITLGFGMIIVNLINNLPFAGQNGLEQGSASSSLYENGLGFSSKQQVAWVFLAILITLAAVTAMFMFIRSKYGRAIRAIRDDEIAAEACGINVSHYKVRTFVYSAFFAGIAGALFACCNGSLSTGTFTFANNSILNSTFIVVMVVLGGMGSLTGSIVSAVLMFLLNRFIKEGAWLSSAPQFVQTIFGYPMLVYSIILVIVIVFRPKGIFGHNEFSLINLPADLKRIFSKKKGKEAGV